MKRIIFDFIRPPETRLEQVESGEAPKESLVGYYHLSKAGYNVTHTSRPADEQVAGKLQRLIRRLEIPPYSDLKKWQSADTVILVTRMTLVPALLIKLMGKELVFYDAMQTLPKHPLKKAMMKLVIRLADKIIGFSENQLREWEKSYPAFRKKGSAIDYGIDSNFFSCNDVQAERTGHYISVGRDPNRDFSILNDFLKNSSRKLVLVTQDYLVTPELRKNPAVRILDGLSYKELENLYHQSQAAIIPLKKGTSHLSGIRASLEAMANRTPVIIAQNRSLEEYFTDRKHVVFFEPECLNSLESALQFLDQPENRTQMVEEAYKLVHDKYNYTRMAEAIIRTIEG
jgi:glycosyltransferase involved in cell wall biosynthesis